MLHKNVIVTDISIQGTGLMAGLPIRCGETIWQVDIIPEINKFKLSDILSWDNETKWAFFKYAWQINDDTFAYATPNQDKSLYMNHSCNPNTWFISDTQMVSARDIEKGEEITYDYSTSQTYPSGFTCACNAQCCRGLLTGDEYRYLWFKEKYSGHVLSYISDKINLL